MKVDSQSELARKIDLKRSEMRPRKEKARNKHNENCYALSIEAAWRRDSSP
jgi:hypothetical protein